MLEIGLDIQYIVAESFKEQVKSTHTVKKNLSGKDITKEHKVSSDCTFTLWYCSGVNLSVQMGATGT